MLDFAPLPEAASWLRAPMPDAAACLALPDRLARLDHEPANASPRLLRTLNTAETSGRIILACDSSGELWRLRHDGAAGPAQLWRLQPLRDSRERLFARLRAALAPELAGRVQHELRNPLNALSLHADLIGRLLQKGGADAAARIAPSVEVIRQRLRELEHRQDAALALWLDRPEEGAAPATLGGVVDDCLRLLRGHLLPQNIRLHADELAPLAAVPLRGAAAPVQLGLTALLLMAAAGAKQYPAADGSARIDLSGAGGCTLELQAPLDGHQFGRVLGDACDTSGVLAGLSLLLEPAGLRLETDARQGLARLSPLK